MRHFFLVLMLISCAHMTQASVLSADFRTESDLGADFDDEGLGPLVYEALGVTIDGEEELTGEDFLENPSDWGGGLVHVDLSEDNSLSLTAQDDWDFSSFDLWITNIAFGGAYKLSGVSFLSGELTEIPSVSPLISFTADSLHISYDLGDDDFFYFVEGATAMFSLEVTKIPEPAVWMLLLVGLVAGQMRRRAKAV